MLTNPNLIEVATGRLDRRGLLLRSAADLVSPAAVLGGRPAAGADTRSAGDTLPPRTAR